MYIKSPSNSCYSFYKSNKRLHDMQEGRWQIFVVIGILPNSSTPLPANSSDNIIVRVFKFVQIRSVQKDFIFLTGNQGEELIFLMGTSRGGLPQQDPCGSCLVSKHPTNIKIYHHISTIVKSQVNIQTPKSGESCSQVPRPTCCWKFLSQAGTLSRSHVDVYLYDISHISHATRTEKKTHKNAQIYV